MTTNLRVFWVSCGGRGHNWGDEFGEAIIRSVSGRETEHVDVDRVGESEIVSAGSTLHLIPATLPIHIWGTGCIQDDHVFRFPTAHIHALRGKLTAKRLGVKDVAFGDPLLLWGAERKSKFRLGIVPHYIDFDNALIGDFAKQNESVLVIDMLSRDAADRIASCDFILSSALHGLVVADALGIPNLWTLFSDNKIVGHGFKFRDYYSAFDIDDPIPYRFFGEQLTTIEHRITDSWIEKPLDQIRADLVDSFPEELMEREEVVVDPQVFIPEENAET